MNKKWLAVVGLAAVIAVSGGVIALTGGEQHPRGADADPTVSDSTYADASVSDDDQPDAPADTAANTAETDPDVTEATESATSVRSDPGNDVNHYSEVLQSTTSYNIARVIDHTNGDECTPREVFGKLYYYCYLAFKSDGTFELCINPSSADLETGTYRIYDDVISIEYADGTGSEYSIISDNEGGIDYIIVNYGDYDVYFG